MQTIYDNPDTYIHEKMKQFRLVDMREQYDELIAEAENDRLSYKDFLIRLLQTEDEGKTIRKHEKLLNKASFDSSKRLSEIDYSFNPSLDKDKIEELGKLHFLHRHENVIIIGPPGVGKSMIATGIGINACNQGHKVLFVNAKELIDTLEIELQEGTLQQFLKKLSKIELLIIDGLSYINMDKEKESIFFQLIRHRYEKRSLIITTNLPLNRWNEIFTGQIAATAILDRILHHCHTLSIPGNSYRVKK